MNDVPKWKRKKLRGEAGHPLNYWNEQRARSQQASERLAALLGPPRISGIHGTENPRPIMPIRADVIKSSMGGS